MNDQSAIRVIIRNERGQYLTGTSTAWLFSDDRAQARVFDYWRDRIPEQIELVRRVHGATWIPVRLEPREAHEICDRCGRHILCFHAFFDGHQFLCGSCRSELGRK